MKLHSAFTKPTKKDRKKLKGEKHEFRDLSVPEHLTRKPVPPQHLTPDDKIESSRKEEVTKGGDPLVDKLKARIALLEAQNAELKANIEMLIREG